MMRFDIIDECESAVFEALCTISTLSMFWVQHVQRVPLWGKFFVWINVREKVVTTPFRGKMAEILNIPIFMRNTLHNAAPKLMYTSVQAIKHSVMPF